MVYNKIPVGVGSLLKLHHNIAKSDKKGRENTKTIKVYQIVLPFRIFVVSGKEREGIILIALPVSGI